MGWRVSVLKSRSGPAGAPRAFLGRKAAAHAAAMALVRSHCASQQELAAIRSELDGRKHKSGGRQKRLTADQIEERLADLEYERTTSHVSIARDRSIMAEIAQLKASRRGMAAQELAHAARETLLDRRTAINAQLDGVFAELDELRAGLAVLISGGRLLAIGTCLAQTWLVGWDLAGWGWRRAGHQNLGRSAALLAEGGWQVCWRWCWPRAWQADRLA